MKKVAPIIAPIAAVAIPALAPMILPALKGVAAGALTAFGKVATTLKPILDVAKPLIQKALSKEGISIESPAGQEAVDMVTTAAMMQATAPQPLALSPSRMQFLEWLGSRHPDVYQAASQQVGNQDPETIWQRIVLGVTQAANAVIQVQSQRQCIQMNLLPPIDCAENTQQAPVQVQVGLDNKNLLLGGAAVLSLFLLLK